jgi:DNA mismatch repair protein MutS2
VRDGRYQVRVERVMMWCRADDLSLPQAASKRKSARQRRLAATSDAAGANATSIDSPAPPARVDLHGLSTDEAIAVVLGAIDQAIRRGADRLEIVHGRGTGRLKVAVHRYLEGVAVVRAFRLDVHNPGVTWVHF